MYIAFLLFTLFRMLQGAKPLVKILDEAGSVGITHYAIALSLQGKNVLIGDDAQLPPLTTSPLEKSLVRRPVTQILPEIQKFQPGVLLNVQYRMVNNFAKNSSTIFFLAP